MQPTDCRKTVPSSGARETVALKETGVNKQRIYDAMLIKAFRKDIRLTDLNKWLAPYGISLEQDNLMRVPNHIWWPGRVQEMVGRYLKPLADRLWDTDPSKDIQTLDWMSKLKCGKGYTNIDKDVAKLKRESNLARKKAGILGGGSELRKRNNQWNITK